MQVMIRMSQEQVTTKVGALLDNEVKTSRVWRKKFKRKAAAEKAVVVNTDAEKAALEKDAVEKCGLQKFKEEDNCAAKDKMCQRCGKVRHSTSSKTCLRTKEIRKFQVEEEDSNLLELLGRVVIETREMMMEF